MDEPKEPEVTLEISGPGGRREVPLDPAGVVIGRGRSCGIRLEAPVVSSRHARIYRDPFGRWIVEDVGSKHGVLFGGRRERARAVLPGETFEIRPFTLSLLGEPTSRIQPDPTASGTSTFVEGEEDSSLTVSEAAPAEPMSRVRLGELNELTDRLMGLGSSGEVYGAVCEFLARLPESAAAVVRLPGRSQPLPESPPVLSRRLGGVSREPAEEVASRMRLSRRVLEAVRSTRSAVMASNVKTSEDVMDLTVIDAHRPRTVFCAPVADQGDTLDALYLDVPADRAAADLFDFFQVVSRQASFAGKGLLLAEERARREAQDRELAKARQIQEGLKPKPLGDLRGIDAAFHYQPAEWVGGDYCDVWAMPDGRLVFAVGDVMGHGLAAAMVMSSLHAALRMAMSFGPGGTEVMGRLSRHLSEHMPEGMFATFFLGLFAPRAGALEYVNAGHHPPLRLGGVGEVEALSGPSNPPLGVVEGEFTPGTARLRPGEGLVLVTDGILESLSPGGEQFGTPRVRELLAHAPQTAEAVVHAVVTAAADFRQLMPRLDDITVFALFRRRGR